MAIDVRGLTPLIQVFDMPTSVHFYRDILGFELLSTSHEGPRFDWALLRRESAEIMLNTMYEADDRPPAPDLARTAAHGDTCFYFGCADIDAAFAHLQAHGVPAKPPSIAPYGMRQMYLLDPDGYNLCFQWPATKETSDRWRAWYGLDIHVP